MLQTASLSFRARKDAGRVSGKTYPGRDDLVAKQVVIVDDQATGRMVLERIIRKIDPRLQIHAFGNALEALEHIGRCTPDLIVTDYKMPEMDGLELIRQVRGLPDCAEVPLVVVTIVDDRSVRYQALDAGASDFISRPVDQYECFARCRNLLQARQQQKIIRSRAAWLENQVALATRKIQDREKETLLFLSRAGEYRDAGTGNHVLRMARYSRVIANGINLPRAECDLIEQAAPLHDIGKIGIPDHILLKPGRLTAEETRIMRMHSEIGYEILASSDSPYIQMGAEIALHHHERFDGSGYPQGLQKQNIPLSARIVAIADVYDALTTSRPYKEAWAHERAVDYLRGRSGSRFDTRCLSAFLERISEIDEIRTELHD